LLEVKNLNVGCKGTTPRSHDINIDLNVLLAMSLSLIKNKLNLMG